MSAIIFCFCCVVCRDVDGSLPLQTKKADVIKHPKVFDHVGLPFNEPPGAAKLLLI
jgi:hypothetical protein